VGVPKTIDNDIGLIDRSFGFNTAVEEARKAVRSAKVEAACAGIHPIATLEGKKKSY
jgi:6-phosphofructokinase 1